MSQNKVKVLMLVVGLVAELEYLLVTNYPIRTEIRALVGIPIYHVLLTLFALATLVRWVTPQSQRPPVGVKVSVSWLLVHLLFYTAFLTGLPKFWLSSALLPPVLRFAAWSVAGVLFLASWLRVWLPFTRWKQLWRLEFDWLSWALPLSLVAPYVAEFASSWWRLFARLTFELTDFGLGLFYTDAVADPSRLLLGTTRFVVEIQPGCSGYEGMGLIAVLMIGYLWLKRDALRMPDALALVPISMVLAYLANIIRLMLLVMIGTSFSASVAMRGFHSQAGWLSFTILSMALVYLLERKQVLARPGSSCASEAVVYEYLAGPYLAPLGGLLFGTMLVQAFSADFPTFYFLKPVVAGILLLYAVPRLSREWVRPQFVLSSLVGILVYAVWVVLVKNQTSVSPEESLPEIWVLPWILVRCFSSVLIVPLAEEIGFRGYLLRRLQSSRFETVAPSNLSLFASLVSSIFFGLLHADPVAGFLAGLAYAWVSSRPGHLSNAVLAHSVTNALLCFQVLYLGQWGLW